MADSEKSPPSEKCVRLNVPEDVCFLHFVKDWDGYVGSREVGMTARGEALIADYDKDGNIISLELHSFTKPCQR